MIESLQHRIDRYGARSLQPGTDRATPLAVLVDRFELEENRRDALSTIVDAHLTHFPDTIFWDYDHLVAFIARSDRDPAVIAREMSELFAQFGRHSVICFRYIHDFLFGVEWVTWVLKEREDRTGTHPFDADALAYLKARGHEIEALIAQNDSKYPQLEKGEPRNAYGFVRDPSQERTLFETLAVRQLIPLQMWSVDSLPRCDRDYLVEREKVADELGFGAPT